MGFLRSILTGKKQESDRERSRMFDYRVYDTAEDVGKNLEQVLAFSRKPGGFDVFITQVAFIFRLQQDVFRHFGVNIAVFDLREMTPPKLALRTKAMEFVEMKGGNLYRELQKVKAARNAEMSAMYGMAVHACNFWLSSMFADTSTFTPLKERVEKNHELLEEVDEDALCKEAKGIESVFIQTGPYEFETSHWPYRGASLEDFMALVNPLQRMDLQQFVHTGTHYRPRHYFKFKEEDVVKEFIVIYDRMDDDLIYSRTMYRKSGETEFSRLNDQVWAVSISHLVELGKSHGARLARDDDHFAGAVR